METDRTSRAVLSAGCLIAASICMSARYLVPAVMMSGKNYSNPAEGFQRHLESSTGLFVIAGLLYLIAAALAIWSFLPSRGRDKGDLQN